jgi:acyl-CoA synthetase (AMP-forming)/AMP-acid ligase II
MDSKRTRCIVIFKIQIHSDAFAYYLAEQGYAQGSKVLFWTDVNHSLEYVAASLGCLKAGTTVISSEFENWEDIHKTLTESKADVLVVSPYVQIEKNITRLDALTKSIPELSKCKKSLI